MKTFLKRIWNFIRNLFNRLSTHSRAMVPIAINVVEALKDVMNSPVDDVLLYIVKRAIPGGADDVLIDKIKETVEKWLPKILVQLQVADSIAGIEDPNERLKAILSTLNLADEETKNMLYHGLASLILEKLSDGELRWSDSVAISEYYYRNFIKHES